MLAILVLVLAALSRLLPHIFHSLAFNFTAVGAGLLFFGSRRPRWQTVLAVAVMALMDVFLTTKVYGYAFHVSGYLVTWAWYAAVCLIGQRVAAQGNSVARGGRGAGFGDELLPAEQLRRVVERRGRRSVMYPHTAAGLGACYAAALPFYGNDLMSTGLFAAAFFGLPVLAARLVEMMHSAQQPMA